MTVSKNARINAELAAELRRRVAAAALGGPEAINTTIKPGRIYALSSGMMTEKTLSNVFARQVISDPQHALFFVGYADPESPAGRLRKAARGDVVQLSPDAPPQPLDCQVEQFNFSAHATRESLRAYVNKVRPKKIILVHGDAAVFFRVAQGDLFDVEFETEPFPEQGTTLRQVFEDTCADIAHSS